VGGALGKVDWSKVGGSFASVVEEAGKFFNKSEPGIELAIKAMEMLTENALGAVYAVETVGAKIVELVNSLGKMLGIGSVGGLNQGVDPFTFTKS
jgi:hypothetical protein